MGLPSAVSLAGGRFAFSLVELIERGDHATKRSVMTLSEIVAWSQCQPAHVSERIEERLTHLISARASLTGRGLELGLERPRLMAVLNVTPDSFSDGGEFFDAERAIEHGRDLLAAGADLIDVGGESTRPGATPVPVAEECWRVLPVITAMTAQGAQLSIDTRRAEVMQAALAAGAMLINDVSGLAGDDASLAVAAESSATVVLMHMSGEPATMQAAPVYQDVVLDVFDWLEARVAACAIAGIPRGRIIVDPGIGFGKTLDHNLAILRQLTLFHGLGVPLLLGVSRKRFVAELSRGEPPKARLAGTLAAGQAALDQGCQMLRVHDLAEAIQARAVWEGLH